MNEIKTALDDEISEITDLPPLGKPLYIQSYLPTSQEIRSKSVLEIENPDDLNSNKLGVSAWEKSCLTCQNFLDECPGHDGSIELSIPIYRIFFVRRLIQILNCVCYYCQRLRLPKTDRKYNWIKQLPAEERLSYLLKASKNYKHCGMKPKEGDDEKDYSVTLGGQKFHDVPSGNINECCHKMFVEFKNEDRDYTFVRAIIRLEESDLVQYNNNNNWKPISIGPQEIFDCINNLDTETKEMMGCDEFNDPACLMWDVLNVPSLNTRPCHTFAGIGSGKKRIFNDWTKFLRKIVISRNALREVMKMSNEKVTCCHYIFNDVESKNFSQCFQYGYLEKKQRDLHKKRLKNDLKKPNFGSVETAWRNLNKDTAAFHSHKHKKMSQQGNYGKPLVNVEDRYKYQKLSRFRGFIVGRRVDNGGRGVLEGDMYQEVDQAGIPMQEAMNVTVKCFVTKLNVTKVQEWILNGPFHHPGANYVMLKNGTEVNLAFHENRRDINTDDILFVRRHLINNDFVIVGRQPTLHRPSMMTFRVLIISGYAIRLHYANFTPLGADCDGDEVNFQVIQTLEAMAEVSQISCVKNNIMKDGKIWIKFIQNAVIGAYLMTKPDVIIDDTTLRYVTDFLDLWELPEAPCSGHQVVSLILPPDLTIVNKNLEIRNGKFIRGQLSDSTLNGSDGILHHLYRDYPDRQVTLDFLHKGYLLFQKYLDTYGHSVGYFDCAIDFHHEDSSVGTEMEPFMDRIYKVQDYVQKMNDYSDNLPNSTPGVSDTVTENNLRDHIDKVTNMSLEAVVNYHEFVDNRTGNQNGILSMINSGAKGSKSTINQMCGIVGQLYVMYRRYPQTSSHFVHGSQSMEAYGCIKESYSKGLPLTALIQEAHPTCESVVNKNKGTSKSGYTIRKLTTCMMGVVVDYCNRAVDTNNRVIWNVYGNDSYDPQCLTLCDMRLLEAKQGTTYLYDIHLLDTFHLTKSSLYEWQQLLDLPTTENFLAKEWEELEKLTLQVRSLMSRSNDNSGFAKARIPFDFQHVFDRCHAQFSAKSAECDVHPMNYREFTLYLWDKLVAEKLIIPFNLVFKIIFMDWLSVYSLFKAKFNSQQLKWLAKEIRDLLARAMIQPGESVGVNATQNMGEPFAQLTLKTPHFSGKFTNIVAGTVRIANIIDSNFCNPQMTIVLKSHIQTRVEAEIFGLSLNRCYLKDIILRYPVYEFTGFEMDRNCSVYIPIDKEKCVGRLISLRSAVKTIASASSMPLDLFQVSYMDSPNEWFIKIRIPMMMAFWKLIHKGLLTPVLTHVEECIIIENIVYNLCNSVVIHGIPSVENFVSDEITIHSLNSKTKETRWTVTTLGSNLRHVLRLPEVDTLRTISNDVTEMCDVFGMHAARKCLENEFLIVLSGMVDSRHIKLVSRMMASDLVIKGMKIKQVAQNIPPLQRAAYEQGPKQMMEYCANSEIDDGKTICGAALLNKPADVGTCYHLDLLAMENVQMSDKLNYQWQNIPNTISHYAFSPKLCGNRYFFVMFRNRQKEKIVALVNTKYQIYDHLNTEHRESDDVFFNGTIIDGYLCQTVYGEVFIAADCLMCCGNKSAVLRYDQRIEICREVLFRLVGDSSKVSQDFPVGASEPYALPICLRPQMSGELFAIGNVPFRFFVKPVFDLKGLEHYSKTWMSGSCLPFTTDGIEFINLNDPAYPFDLNPTQILTWRNQIMRFVVVEPECDELPSFSTVRQKHNLSVKSAQQVDQYRKRNRSQFDLLLLCSDSSSSYFHFTFGSGATVECLSNVCNCKWNNEKRIWQVLGPTNEMPDTLHTVLSFLETVSEPINLF